MRRQERPPPSSRSSAARRSLAAAARAACPSRVSPRAERRTPDFDDPLPAAQARAGAAAQGEPIARWWRGGAARPRPAVGAAGDGGPGRGRPAQRVGASSRLLGVQPRAHTPVDPRPSPAARPAPRARSRRLGGRAQRPRGRGPAPAPARSGGLTRCRIAAGERPAPRTGPRLPEVLEHAQQRSPIGDRMRRPVRSGPRRRTARARALKVGSATSDHVGRRGRPCAVLTPAVWGGRPGLHLHLQAVAASARSRCGRQRVGRGWRDAGPQSSVTRAAAISRRSKASRVRAGTGETATTPASATIAALGRRGEQLARLAPGCTLGPMARDTGLPSADAQFDFGRARRRRALSRLRPPAGRAGDVNVILPFEEVVAALGRRGERGSACRPSSWTRSSGRWTGARVRSQLPAHLAAACARAGSASTSPSGGARRCRRSTSTGSATCTS